VTEAQAVELISATFAAAWPTASGGVPFALEGEAFAPPPPGETFAHLSVLLTEAGGGQLTSGEPGTRLVGRGGWIVVKLWGPADQGAAGVRALVEAVRSIFEMQNLVRAGDPESVDTQATVPTPLATDGRWVMLLARTPFTVFETK
jgi:hypothetical protein